METRQRIIEAVENYFERREAKYEPFNEKGVARAGFTVKSKLHHVDVILIATDDRLVIKSLLPLKADEEVRAKVGEFILRANYGLRCGGFDYDCDDGEISYRVCLLCGEDEDFAAPTYGQIEEALLIGVLMVSKYGDALLKVLFGMAEPVDAIEAADA